MTRVRRTALLLVVLSSLLALPSCGVGAGDDEVVVLAASSLATGLTDVAEAWEVANPDVDVVLSFAGSSTLREQVLGGAPADVLVTADTADVAAVVGAGLASDPVVVATNVLALVVPVGNPGGVSGLEDLADTSLVVGLCAEQVPCGRLATAWLDVAGVVPAPDTREPDVRALATKVALGEVEVGVVYRTDVVADDALVEVTTDVAPVATSYPAVVLDDAPNPDAARAFLDHIGGDEAQALLRDRGFGAP